MSLDLQARFPSKSSKDHQTLFAASKSHKLIYSSELLLGNQDSTKTIVVIYGKMKVKLDAPIKWTINELKCLLMIKFQTLSFNCFELQVEKLLVPGNTFIQDIYQEKQLFVTKIQCPSQSFSILYAQTMKKVLKNYKITTNSTLFPITNPSISSCMLFNIPKNRQKNIQKNNKIKNNLNIQLQNENGGEIRLLNVIRFFGVLIFLYILYSAANIFQIIILSVIILAYFLMDYYVDQSQHKRRLKQKLQRLKSKQEYLPKDKEQINKDQEKGIVKELEYNPVRAKVILWGAWLLEAYCCFLFALFPNWNVEAHLIANEEKINEIIDKVKRLDPQASEMVRNWKKIQKNEDKVKNL